MTKKTKTLLLQGLLFIIVFITTTFSGTEWISGKYVFVPETEYGWADFVNALNFSVPFLLILTVHEFGHYIVARIHKVDVSLPFYIPLWFGFLPLFGLPILPSIGTGGALIKIKERLDSKLKFFDIGIAGPLAGFVVALFVLFYGFTHLPPQEYIYDIHPEYEYFGENYADIVYTTDTVVYKKDYVKFGRNIPSYYPDTLVIKKDREMIAMGSNLLFKFFENYVVEDESRIPDRYEMYHYPWIFAGFLALFFTALNLLPIGQLDGGHILYGLLGPERQYLVSRMLFYALIFYAGLGIIPLDVEFSLLLWYSGLYIGFLYICVYRHFEIPRERLVFAVVIFSIQFLVAWIFPGIKGYSGWLLFAFILGRFIGIKHPPTIDNAPLDINRQILGWIALIIFVLSFSPQPFVITGG